MTGGIARSRLSTRRSGVTLILHAPAGHRGAEWLKTSDLRSSLVLVTWLDGSVNYQELFADVRRRPGMFCLDGTFHDFTVFVRGCEAGNDWQLLTGFREWLVTRVGGGDNLIWEALVLRLAFPEQSHGPTREELAKDSVINNAAVERLFELLDEFLQLRAEHGGVAKIFDEYWRWRRAQPWS